MNYSGKIFNQSRIGRQLIISIIVFSFFMTLLITAVELYNDYKSDLKRIHTEIELIRKNHLEALVYSIWIFDKTATQIILDSLVKYQDIEFLKVTIDEGATLHSGTSFSKRQIKETIPLLYFNSGEYSHIGELDIIASIDAIYKRIYRRFVFILITNGLKAFFVALFSFVLFQHFITRHLMTLGSYAKQIIPGKEFLPLVLDRGERKNGLPDELDSVVEAINLMQKNLFNDMRVLLESKEEISKSQNLLNDIIEGADDAIFLKDLDGKYLLVNTATCQAIGKSREEILGKDDSELFPGRYPDVHKDIDSSVLRSGKSRTDEERIDSSSGDVFWMTNKSPYRDKDGKIIGLIGISRNITNIKNYEKEKQNLELRLRQAQKLEAIGTLAGGIAHDFNNILGVILGYAEIAREDAPSGSELEKNIDQVLIGGNRAKDLVSQILTFSRQNRAELIPIRMHTIIKEGLKMMRSSIPSTISIIQDIETDGGTVLADPTQVNQVLINLCTNAYHAMEQKGGILTVTLKTVSIGPDEENLSLRPGEYNVLTVADTGVGIRPDIIERIFDPYFTTKDIGKGTGMGLAIIHGILNECEGAITVDSASGEGAVFNVYFPVVQESVVPPKQEPADLSRGQERILFVDDEEVLAEVGKAMLEQLGYHVTVRQSSTGALETFKDRPQEFDLVITDQTMPDLTGADLSVQLMQIRADIPIILCTGYSNIIDESSSKEMGIKGFLLKPFTKKVLSKMIRKVLDGS